MTANRSACITSKIKTRHGNHFLHLDHSNGRITGISISSPGKFADSEIGELLRAIGETADTVIAEIAGAK